MFEGQSVPGASDELKRVGVKDGREYKDKTGNYSIQYTVIFNAYVMMQFFNEINSRKLNGELNVFEGIEKNKYFGGILVATTFLQILFVEFGGPAVGCSDKGLNLTQWLICIGIGAGTIIWQFFMNLLAKVALQYMH